MKKSIEDNEDLDKTITKTAYWTLGVVIFVWLILGFVPYFMNQTLGDAGTFGDSFGFVNSLLSSLGLAGAICAIVLQIRELRYQRQELQESQETWRSQSKAMLLAALLQGVSTKKDGAASLAPFVDDLVTLVGLEIDRLKDTEYGKIRELIKLAKEIEHSLPEIPRQLSEVTVVQFHLMADLPRSILNLTSSIEGISKGDSFLALRSEVLELKECLSKLSRDCIMQKTDNEWEVKDGIDPEDLDIRVVRQEYQRSLANLIKTLSVIENQVPTLSKW